MSILDINETLKKTGEFPADLIGYWRYLNGNDSYEELDKDGIDAVIVNAIDITKRIISSTPECCRKGIEAFYKTDRENLCCRKPNSCIGCQMKGISGLEIDRINTPIHNKTYECDDKSVTYSYQLLGVYCLEGKKIILYLKAIEEEAKKCKIEIEYLIATVLIHELMHAIMDTGSMYGCYPPNSLYAFWKEESYANALTLLAIRNYKDQKLAQQAERFMESQPDPYQYGVCLANNNPRLTHSDWKEEKKNNNDPIPIEEQKEWLDNAINAMMDICSREEKLKESFNGFWNDILNTTTEDYYSKMAIEHLIRMKNAVSNINNIITLKVTLAFVKILFKTKTIGIDDALKMRQRINETSANANGYDIEYNNPLTNCRILAEIKCNIPVKEKFGQNQQKGILKDIEGLEKGKNKGGVSNTSDYQRFMVFLDTGESINAVENLLKDKYIINKIDKFENNKNTYIVFVTLGRQNNSYYNITSVQRKLV